MDRNVLGTFVLLVLASGWTTYSEAGQASDRDTVKIAAVQVCGYDKGYIERPGFDPGEAVVKYIKRASEDGAQLVVFPEYVLGRIAVPGPVTEKISRAAAAAGIYVIVGCWEVHADGSFANTALLFDRQGHIQGKYHKTHAAVDTFEGTPAYAHPPAGRSTEWFIQNDPEWIMEKGQDLPVFDLDFARVGILTCYDGWFPEPFRVLSLKGAEIIVWINGRGGSVEGFIVKTAMFHNSVALVTANQAYGGGTMIADWPATIKATCPPQEESYVSASIDLKRLRDIRKHSRNYQQRRPDLYGEILQTQTAWGRTTLGTDRVPGVVMAYAPPSSKIYIGSPGIAVCSDGTYVAKYDECGEGSSEWTSAVTHVVRSRDRGASWEPVATIDGLFWATLFAHGSDLYLLGTDRHDGAVVIRRSSDGGRTWTTPQDARSGLLLDGGNYHCAPVPVLVHRGRLWRAMEDVTGNRPGARHFRAFMMSAPVDADLLSATSWTSSSRIEGDPTWLGGKFDGWLEGNAVATPAGDIVNVLRVEYRPEGGKAAVVRVSGDGRRAMFDPNADLIDLPGGTKKFTIRYDPVSNLYWTLANPVLPKHRSTNPGRVRNALALMCSQDLREWTMRCVVLYHPDPAKHGFQYVDWLFEGEDMIVVSRTAFVAGPDEPPRQHDANYLTFHRLGDFRQLTMADSAPGARPGEEAWTRP